MKLKLSLLLAHALFFAQTLVGQDLENATFQVNNVKATIHANGTLFWDGQDGRFIAPYEPGQPEVSTMRAAGIWLAGVDPGGNLKGAVQLYGENGKTDFQKGPLQFQAPLNVTPLGMVTKFYRVTKTEILAHIADFQDNGVVDNPNPNIFGWPGKGNPFFSEYHAGDTLIYYERFLAPYFDNDSDNFYYPNHGDFPVLSVRGCELEQPNELKIPDEMLWFVFNDKLPHTESGIPPMQIEVQCTVFGFNCQEAPLGNTVFVQYKIINLGFENLDSTYFGLFSDFDIGNPGDDFFGSDADRKLVFGYNGDPLDEGGYGSNIPVMAIDLLRGPLDSSMMYAPLAHVMPVETGSLSSPASFYNLLQGKYADGSPAPNNGFFYDGNPSVPGDWSEVADGNTPGERRVLSSFGPFYLQPGAVNELIAAFTFNREPGNTVAQNLALMYEQSAKIQLLFDNCFDLSVVAPCTATPTASTSRQPVVNSVNVFPNPFSEELNIDLSNLATPPARVDLVATPGQVVWTASGDTLVAGRLSVSKDKLPAGMYWLVVTGKDGTRAISKVIKH